ncbi:hypothetical protein ALO95_200379 [Pseudomonas syringae pv. antirrhini]|uniref:hypothetical protein n=1 Tax=Pseudomonas syringae group genomosp. 3 TaxID=251701 RepID=UPI000EFCB230|nr:hypothetical protein [Pseudomonas syringae group genomosp. 3]RMP44306.1 hypothetical protein ALQ23_200019 [Pseudomonas syringae pv. antirrhini]RMW26002.1 hypothetical protein ALO95_200379 [Pseudomonas syringae pv. antirrhini]
MQLHEVDEIQELFNVKDVNQALTQGWRIVAVTSSVEPSSGELSVACYVLGRYLKKEQKMPTAADIARANNL